MPDIRTLTLPTPYPVGEVNAFLIVGDVLTLVDTGTHHTESVEALKMGLQRHGFLLQDLEQIVISHMHTDHFAGIFQLQKEIDVPVYVHERAAPLVRDGDTELERQDRFMQQFMERCGAHELARKRHRYITEWQVANVRFVKEGDVLQAGGDEYTVLYVPGHSQTDICLWHEASGCTIAGDTLLEHISANAFVEPPPPGESERPRPLLQFRKSLQRLQDLPLGDIYPGHGEPYKGHAALVERRFAEQAKRCEQIMEILATGSKTVLQLSSELFPRLHGNAVFLGLSEVAGHLDLLLEQGRIQEIQLKTLNLYRSI